MLPLDRALIAKTVSRTKDFNKQQLYAPAARFCPQIPPYTQICPLHQHVTQLSKGTSQHLPILIRIISSP